MAQKALQLRHFSHVNIKLTTKNTAGLWNYKEELDLLIPLTHAQETCCRRNLYSKRSQLSRINF